MARREDNLHPFTSEQSREKAKENGKKGGIASGQAKRDKKNIRLAVEALLEMDIKGKNGEVKSGAEAICVAQLQKALKGDTRAFEALRDSAGQKPIERVMVAEVDQSVIDEIEKEILDDGE